MAANDPGLRSQSTIGGHPIHPMLIPFPIAFLVGALGCDLVFWATDDTFWARAAAWLIGAGFVMGLVAAVFGLVDFLFIRRVREINAAWYHFIGNAAVLLLSLWNLAMRLDDPVGTILPLGIILSAIVTVILLFTGWYGGELAYKHKIGAVDGLPTGIEAAERPLYAARAQAQAESEREEQQRG